MKNRFFFAALVLGVLVISASTLLAQGTGEKSSQPMSGQKPGDKTAGNSGALGVGVDPATFILGPEDLVNVRVWREPDVSGVVAVRPDGKITLPLAGDIQAAGLTPKQLTERVQEALKKYINSPEVFIAVQDVRSKKYLVSGEVNRPGIFPLVGPTTVMEAVVNAGGFRDFANKKKIIIMRGTERLRFNYNEVVKGKNLSQNIQLQNGDNVVVE